MSTTARTNRAKMTARMEKREADIAEARKVVEAASQLRLERLKDEYTAMAARLGITVPREYWDWTPLEQYEWTKANLRAKK